MASKVCDLAGGQAPFDLVDRSTGRCGHRLPVESRAFGRGVADQELMAGGLERWDQGGGGMDMQETYVTVTPC